MVDWGNTGIVWRLLAAAMLVSAVSALYAWCDFPAEAAIAVFGSIVGFFFGQYMSTPE